MAGYLVFISSLYLLNFSEGEVNILSSFNRYVGTIFYSMYIACMGLFFISFNKINKIKIVFLLFFLMAPATRLQNLPVGIINSDIRQAQYTEYRREQEIKKDVYLLKNLTGEQGYVIMDYGRMYDNIRCNYYAFPLRVAQWGYIDQMEPKYTHIVLLNDQNPLDNKFIEDYGKYFSDNENISEGAVFEIDWKEKPIPVLHYLGNMPLQNIISG